MNHATPKDSGFTLLEIAISLSIVVMITVAAGSIFGVGSDSLDLMARSETIDHQLSHALGSLGRDLKAASAAGTTIDASDTNHDRISFQVFDPEDVSGDPSWGYWDADGVFQADWSCLYQVDDEGVLSRTVLDDAGDTARVSTLCREVDDVFDDGSGATKGFRVAVINNLVTVGLRVRDELPDGQSFRRGQETAIRQLNP